jgi:gamma-aminobutyric acid receptor subunit beta
VTGGFFPGKSTEPSFTNEDIIELQDVRMSPIASIRNRHNSKSHVCDLDSSKFPPSFRISRTSGYTYNYRTSAGLRFRGTKGSPPWASSSTVDNNFVAGNSVHRPKVLHAIRKGALVLKASMPKIKDVNVIDKYSRIVFPVTFLLFNAGYWLFYFFE